MDNVIKRYRFLRDTSLKVKTHDEQVKDATISSHEGMMLCLYDDGRVRATNGEWWRWCLCDAARLDLMVKEGIIEELAPPARPVRKYKILKNVMLGFLGLQEQHDEIVGSNDGVVLECDDRTIWAVKGGKRIESITTANVIDIWIKNGFIQELP